MAIHRDASEIHRGGFTEAQPPSEGRGSPALRTTPSVKGQAPTASSSPLLPPFLSPLQASKSPPSHHNLLTSLPTEKTCLCPCPHHCSSGLQAFKAAKSSVPCYSAAQLAGSPSRGDRAREKPLHISKKKKKGLAFVSCQAALAGCVLMDIPLLCQHPADPSRS